MPVDAEFQEDSEESPREDLIEKLLEYQKYKMVSEKLEEMSEESEFIPRKNTDLLLFNLEEDQDENWRSLSIIELVTAFAEVLSKKAVEPKEYEIEKVDYTVEDKIHFLKELLKKEENIQYFEAINASMSRTELICMFLAILEMVKLGYMIIRQHKIFGDIHIVRKRIPQDNDDEQRSDFDLKVEEE